VIAIVTYLVMAAFGAGGGMLGGMLVTKLRLQEEFPQALWFGRVLGAYAWSQIARRLYADLQKAIKESKAA
jgi:hypothetical protein